MTDLPDFDDFIQLSEDIKQLMIVKADLDNKIEIGKANTFKRALTDMSLFLDNKPPSISMIKALYEYTGIDGELIPLREAFALANAELKRKQAEFDMMKTKIDIYRTESANKRASL